MPLLICLSLLSVLGVFAARDQAASLPPALGSPTKCGLADFEPDPGFHPPTLWCLLPPGGSSEQVCVFPRLLLQLESQGPSFLPGPWEGQRTLSLPGATLPHPDDPLRPSYVHLSFFLLDQLLWQERQSFSKHWLSTYCILDTGYSCEQDTILE